MVIKGTGKVPGVQKIDFFQRIWGDISLTMYSLSFAFLIGLVSLSVSGNKVYILKQYYIQLLSWSY